MAEYPHLLRNDPASASAFPNACLPSFGIERLFDPLHGGVRRVLHLDPVRRARRRGRRGRDAFETRPSSPNSQALRNRSGPISPCSKAGDEDAHPAGALPAGGQRLALRSAQRQLAEAIAVEREGDRRRKAAPRHRACAVCRPSKSDTPSTPSSTASPSMTNELERFLQRRLDDQRIAIGPVVAVAGE